MKLDFQDIMSAVPAYCDPSTWPETWNPWLILLELPPFDPACNFLPDTQAALLHCSLAASAPTASPLRSLGSGCMECRTCAVLNEGRSCLCAPAWPKMMYVFGGGSLVAKLWLTLCDPRECSPPGSSLHDISQARILECIAISFSRGSSRPRDGTCGSCSAARFFTAAPPG